MKKTIVEIHYRGYVPRDWIALKICSIAFSGENSLKFNDDCRKIEFSEYYIYNPQCEELEKQIIKQKELIKDTKKWYNLFEIKEEKELVIMQ